MKFGNEKHLKLLKSPAVVDEKAFDEILTQTFKEDEQGAKAEQVPTSIFENRKRWIKAQDVARELGISVRTVYDWHHRPHRRNTPPGLFNKFNGHLFLSTEALNLWMTQQATRRRR
ncbi:MAG: helix-turn-helix domain-containing protein [Deltaproteobacteria bacterium]|jgi:DNA-binding transcriptional regulator YiaG|nr:helix-turn-helix domain-containing protein [Deltaproteobacteria bacterium]